MLMPAVKTLADATMAVFSASAMAPLAFIIMYRMAPARLACFGSIMVTPTVVTEEKYNPTPIPRIIIPGINSA